MVELHESDHLHGRKRGRHRREAFNVAEINSDAVVGLGSHRPPGYELRGHRSKNTQESRVAFKRPFNVVTRLSVRRPDRCECGFGNFVTLSLYLLKYMRYRDTEVAKVLKA